jgi:hypothetical protein
MTKPYLQAKLKWCEEAVAGERECDRAEPTDPDRMAGRRRTHDGGMDVRLNLVAVRFPKGLEDKG